jgi:phosphatidylserine/phosphatidylglycerophosphate/cardiolipin synthase-like enzyme
MAGRWLKAFRGAQRSNAEFLLDGEEAFASIVEAIRSADSPGHYVYILGWMIDLDFQLTPSGPKLYELLSAAAAKGVQIRLLIWDNPVPGYQMKIEEAETRLNRLQNTKMLIDGMTFFPPKALGFLQPVLKRAVELVRYYRSEVGAEKREGLARRLLKPSTGAALDVKRLDAEAREVYKLSPLYYEYRLLTMAAGLTNLGAHHDKVTVVKGKNGLVAFCGGIDYNANRVFVTFDKQRLRLPAYHDTACRLEGPAAFEVLQKFKMRWRNHPGGRSVPLHGENEAPPPAKPSFLNYPYAKVVGTYNHPDGSAKDKDRSARDAYYAIIDNAKDYIYIEDQYLVNKDIAARLNAKIRQPSFRKLILLIQNASETTDIMIPSRKRGEFLDAVMDGTSEREQEKVLLAVVDSARAKTDLFHPGLHAKTLIADDEIAVIGSPNFNQRSLTCDSETAVVVFEDEGYSETNFAYRFRVATFADFRRRGAHVYPIDYKSWWNFASVVGSGSKNFIVTKYERDDVADLDVRIADWIKKVAPSPIEQAVVHEVLGRDLLTTSTLLSPHTPRIVLDALWDALIDPKVD